MCHNTRGSLFENYFVMARQDKYDLVCVLYAYDKITDKTKNSSDFNGGHPLPKYSKVKPLKFLCIIINFIDT